MDTNVEFTARYATSVLELSEAWAFVMEYVDKVGDSPSISINPIWVFNMDSDPSDEDRGHRKFEVCVSGMVEMT